MKQPVILIMLTCLSCSVIAQEKVDERDLVELKSRMEGAFSSELQAKTDPGYENIQLHTVQIWPRSEDGYWLYTEQAVASSLKKPYKQLIYHIYKQDDHTLVSKVFGVNAPLRFAGAYANLDLLKGLTVDSLIGKQGCAVYLRKDMEGNFSGSTYGKECLSSLHDSTYATSEVLIKEDKLVSWDREWNKQDKQVWGKEKGGYQFIKQKE